MIPSSSDLNYFVEAAKSGNLSRAAERLGISQPSLSVAIQRLEEALGTQLLIRTKKGVMLTQAGKQLMGHSLELIQGWEKIRSRTLASVNEAQGYFAIGCHPSVALFSLPKFLPKALELYPKLKVRLVHDLFRKVAEGVIQMEIDIGIVVNPVRHPDLVIKKLCTDEVALWVCNETRKTQDPTSGEAVLICDPDLLQTQSLLRKIKKAGLEFSRTVTTSNLEVVASLAASGAGVGILPSRVVGCQHAKHLKRLLGAPTFQDEVCLIYRHELKNVCSIQVLTRLIQEGFTD